MESTWTYWEYFGDLHLNCELAESDTEWFWHGIENHTAFFILLIFANQAVKLLWKLTEHG
jgi:hypothetical protein